MSCDVKTVFVDGVDWQHEIGETDATVWPSLNSILNHTPCAKTCGVVKCEMKILEWVHPQDLHKEEDAMSKDDWLLLQEGHIARHQQRIDQIQKMVARIRSEKVESCGDYEVVSNCEGIKVNHKDDGRRAHLLKTGSAYYHTLEGKKKSDNVSLEMFKQECKKYYDIEFDGHGYSA